MSAPSKEYVVKVFMGFISRELFMSQASLGDKRLLALMGSLFVAVVGTRRPGAAGIGRPGASGIGRPGALGIGRLGAGRTLETSGAGLGAIAKLDSSPA